MSQNKRKKMLAMRVTCSAMQWLKMFWIHWAVFKTRLAQWDKVCASMRCDHMMLRLMSNGKSLKWRKKTPYQCSNLLEYTMATSINIICQSREQALKSFLRLKSYLHLHSEQCYRWVHPTRKRMTTVIVIWKERSFHICKNLGWVLSKTTQKSWGAKKMTSWIISQIEERTAWTLQLGQRDHLDKVTMV